MKFDTVITYWAPNEKKEQFFSEPFMPPAHWDACVRDDGIVVTFDVQPEGFIMIGRSFSPDPQGLQGAHRIVEVEDITNLRYLRTDKLVVLEAIPSEAA